MTLESASQMGDMVLAEDIERSLRILQRGEHVDEPMSAAECIERCIEGLLGAPVERFDLRDDHSFPIIVRKGPFGVRTVTTHNPDLQAYLKATYEGLSPAQVLSVLDDHGYPVNTYGFGSDGKELHRLPG